MPRFLSACKARRITKKIQNNHAKEVTEKRLRLIQEAIFRAASVGEEECTVVLDDCFFASEIDCYVRYLELFGYKVSFYKAYEDYDYDYVFTINWGDSREVD